MSEPGRDISLLFDLFVTANRVGRLVDAALAGAPLGAGEYAIYSLLFENGPMTATEMARAMGMAPTTVLDRLRVMAGRGHLRRSPHPGDGRAQHLSLTVAGVADHRRTNAAWEPMRRQVEESLPIPAAQVRRALRALDDAARVALQPRERGVAV